MGGEGRVHVAGMENMGEKEEEKAEGGRAVGVKKKQCWEGGETGKPNGDRLCG